MNIKYVAVVVMIVSVIAVVVYLNTEAAQPKAINNESVKPVFIQGDNHTAIYIPAQHTISGSAVCLDGRYAYYPCFSASWKRYDFNNQSEIDELMKLISLSR